MFEINVDSFAQQVQFVQRRLDKLYQGATASIPLKPELLPLALKELGVFAEELQVAVEVLQQQNTELAAIRIALEAERQRYQELFEFAPYGYLVTDMAGVIQEANSAAIKLLNVAGRFLIGKPLLIFIAEDERQAFLAQLQQLQNVDQVKNWVLNLCPRDSQPIPASLTATVVRDSQDRVVGLRLGIRDLSDAGLEFHLGNWAKAEREKNHNSSQEDAKQSYLKGETIALQPQTICLVNRGIVKLSTISATGEEVLLALAGPKTPFGPDLTSLKTYQATALCEVELEYLPLRNIAANPQYVAKFLSQVIRRQRQTEALLSISGQRHVKDRLYNLLLLLQQEIGQPVEQGTRLSVRLTHQDIATACSTTRVTITRMIGKLQEQGKIFIDSYNHIIVKEQKS